MPVTFERARQLRDQAESELVKLVPPGSIVSIGIGRRLGGFVIAVELNSAKFDDAAPPALNRVEEVPVVYDFVGPAVAADD